MTLRGAECLRRADVVVLDALVDRRVLRHCSPGVKIIEAGKRGGGRVFLRQPAINRLLVRLAKAGKTVVRLKGGDPYFFGRGAEEAEVLADHGIPFEVVPGVSAVTSVPGFAGDSVDTPGACFCPYGGDGARRAGKSLSWGKRRSVGTAARAGGGFGQDLSDRNTGHFNGAQTMAPHFALPFGFGMAARAPGGGDSMGELGPAKNCSRHPLYPGPTGSTGKAWRSCRHYCG